MKKDYKKLYMYAIIMTVSVLVIVLIACLSESRIDSYQTEYENKLTARKTEIDALEKKVAELEDENSELKKQNESSMTAQSKLDAQNQIFSDLTQIYMLAKQGKMQEAKTAFSAIETGGFDDSALAYYEILKDMLEK